MIWRAPRFEGAGIRWDAIEPRSMPVLTCHEPTDEPIATGLLDADGNKIMRTPPRRRLGFLPPLTQDLKA